MVTGTGARRDPATLKRADLEAALAALPVGPFLSVFVTHEILDAEAFAQFQPRSDGESLKPPTFGGRVIAFARPPVVASGGEPVVTLAVIEWPDPASFLAWRFQPLYDEAMLALRARAERGSVYFLPIGVFEAGRVGTTPLLPHPDCLTRGGCRVSSGLSIGKTPRWRLARLLAARVARYSPQRHPDPER